jgi:hypothetical protein
VNQLRALLMASLMWVAIPCQAGEFQGVRLFNDGASLEITSVHGKAVPAPKLGTQDGFDQPALSPDRRYVGWLAMYPGRGASYSQPVELVVMDEARRLHRFFGEWGMVYGWCFAPGGRAVIYRYSFSHGDQTPGFDMRRIEDGRLLKRYRMPDVGVDVDLAAAVRAEAPSWTRCAQQREE